MAQIYPVWDEDTSEESQAISASFADPYILIIRSDQSILILQADQSGDLDEVPADQMVQSVQWTSGSLYRDKHRIFAAQTELKAVEPDDIYLFLLSSEGKLFVILFTLQPILLSPFQRPLVELMDSSLLLFNRYSTSQIFPTQSIPSKVWTSCLRLLRMNCPQSDRTCAKT